MYPSSATNQPKLETKENSLPFQDSGQFFCLYGSDICNLFSIEFIKGGVE